MKKKLRVLFSGLFFLFMLPSCTVVKEFEKININDPDMALSDRKSEHYINTFQAYREAASGANGGKTGGGCGCN